MFHPVIGNLYDQRCGQELSCDTLRHYCIVDAVDFFCYYRQRHCTVHATRYGLRYVHCIPSRPYKGILREMVARSSVTLLGY